MGIDGVTQYLPIKQTPWSASTRAPASNVHSFETGLRRTYAVKPTALAPWPVVNTARGAIFSVYFKNCDLAVPTWEKIRSLKQFHGISYLLYLLLNHTWISHNQNVDIASHPMFFARIFSFAAEQRQCQCTFNKVMTIN